MGARELCIMACTFCRQAEFLSYLQAIDPQGMMWTEEQAKSFILAACGITTRSELDRNAAAARKFHELVRHPYLAWRENRSGQV